MKGCDAYEKDRKRIMFYHKASPPCDDHLVNKNSTNDIVGTICKINLG